MKTRHWLILAIWLNSITNPGAADGFPFLILSKGAIDLVGNNIQADGFDSEDANYSTDGRYDPAKAKASADIATLSGLSGALSVGDAQIMGRVFTGPGGSLEIGPNGTVGGEDWVLSGQTGIQPGHAVSDLGAALGEVVPPFTSGAIPPGGTVDGVTYDYLLGTGDWVVSSLSGRVLVDGNARLYVSSSFSLSGADGIWIRDGASLQLHSAASTASIGGIGVVNETGLARNFQYYGLPSNTEIKLTGSGHFVGVVCAPTAHVQLGGGGNDVYDCVGAFIGDSFSINGKVLFHYDEALFRALDLGRQFPWLTLGLSLESRDARAGQTVTFTVDATGTEPLVYQWQKDGLDLPGATDPTLTLTDVQPPDAGTYTVHITNPAGSLTSDSAELVVASGTGTVNCHMAARYMPNEPLQVTLHALPDAGVLAYEVEDRIPAGWTLGDISHGGRAVDGGIHWGPFNDDLPRMLGYRVTPPSGLADPVTFTGIGRFDGQDRAIEGQRSLVANSAVVANDDPWNKIAPRAQVRQDGVLVIPFAAVLENDLDPDGDALTVIAVSANSTQGGLVAMEGTLILYTPPARELGQDTFSYTCGDGHGSTATAMVTVHVRNIRWQNGKAHDGYVAGALVFLDTNANRQWDEDEPHGFTDAQGTFSIPFVFDAYDLNYDGVLKVTEALWVVEGGVDIATGLPLSGQLTSPAEATVVNPLTHLIAGLLFEPGLESAPAATSQVLATLGVGHPVDLLHYDPIAAAVTNDAVAGTVFHAAAQVHDTTVQMAALLSAHSGTTETDAARAVAERLTRSISSGDDLNLQDPVALAELLTTAAALLEATLPVEIVAGAAEIIEAGNRAKTEAMQAAGSSLEQLLEISRLQGVLQGPVAAALARVGAGTAFIDDAVAQNAGPAFYDLVQTASVGDLTGTSTQTGVFSFRSASFHTRPDDTGPDPVTVTRTDGSQGAVDLLVTATLATQGATPGMDESFAAPITFQPWELSKSVSLSALFNNGPDIPGGATLNLTLSLSPSAPNDARLGDRDTAILTLIDSTQPSVFAFASHEFRVREDGVRVTLPTIIRTGGGSEEVQLLVTPLALPGQAQPGLDYDPTSILVTFPPHNYTRRVDIPVYTDDLLEGEEQVRLTLALVSAAPSQVLLGEPANATLILVDDPNRQPAVRIHPPARLSHADFRLVLSGTPGQRFILQQSVNLSDWQTVAGGELSVEPTTVQDPHPAASHRYYRVILAP